MHVCQGQCHCGNLSVRLTLSTHTHSITAQSCRCHFCRLHGALWIGQPATNIEFSAEMGAQVSVYEDRGIDANYVLCKNCGTVAGAVSYIDEELYCSVNANILSILSTDVDIDVMQCGPHPHLNERKELRRIQWAVKPSFCPELAPLVLGESDQSACG